MPFKVPRRGVTAYPRILRETIRSGDIGGSRQRLEAEFCRRYGHKLAVATSSGRQGLRLLLRAVPSRIPRVAYVPALTIEAVPQIFRQEGFEVVFIDLDPQTLSLSPEAVLAACRGPGLLLVTHYFGLPADMQAIMSVAVELGLEVIEDCAHIPSGRYRDRSVGTFGLGGFFSFETRKPLNGLGGGMVVTHDVELAERVRRIQAQGTPSRLHDLRKLLMVGAEWLSLHAPFFDLLAPLLHREEARRIIVSVYRRWHARSREPRFALSDLQAHLVLVQLDTLESDIRRKRRLASIYDALLPDDAVRPYDAADRRHGYYMYVILHPAAAGFGRWLRQFGVDCGMGNEVLLDCSPGANLPGTRRTLRQAVELPMYPTLTERQVRRICDIAARFR